MQFDTGPAFCDFNPFSFGMFNDIAEDEIFDTNAKLSAICPLIIRRQCPSMSCTHVQSFDAITFIKMCERREFCICTRCGHRVSFSDIKVHDRWIKALKSVPEDFKELEFTKDGTLHSIKTDVKELFVLKEDIKGSSSGPEIVAVKCDCNNERSNQSQQNQRSSSTPMNIFDDDDALFSMFMYDSIMSGMFDMGPASMSTSVPEDFDLNLYEFANSGTRYSQSHETQVPSHMPWFSGGSGREWMNI